MNTEETNELAADGPDMSGAGVEAEQELSVALVDRVARRVALGMPLKIALAEESVSCQEYLNQLWDRPELAEREELARQKFLEHALNVILDGKDTAGNFRWLIGLVYADVLGSEDEARADEKEGTMKGIPEYVVKYIRREAAKASKEPYNG
ncbi:MAG: hypothetical protein ACREE6_13230 [Limisphaerales bacterium]